MLEYHDPITRHSPSGKSSSRTLETLPVKNGNLANYALLNKTPLYLPSSEELPDSDETPVDNELQESIAHVLKAILVYLWEERKDWLFGVDMGIYTHPDKPAIIPDGFLTLGLTKVVDDHLRSSYVLWEEQVTPIFVLEVVSKKRRGEYKKKKEEYAKLNILYYAIYNPFRKIKRRLEVYKLQDGKYQDWKGNPVWLPEIGLGIGAEKGSYHWEREWLYWYDQQGHRYPTSQEAVKKAEARAQDAEARAQDAEARAQDAEARALEEAIARQQAQALAQRLAQQLRALGFNPDELT